MTVDRILRGKSHHVTVTEATATLAAVCGVLSEKRIGAVPVMDGARLIGIISERDVVRALAAHGAAALEKPVAEIMTRAVRTILRETAVEQAMEIITQGRFRHLPVVEAGQMVGIVSIGDIVKIRLDDQQREVDDLKSYVAGSA